MTRIKYDLTPPPGAEEPTRTPGLQRAVESAGGTYQSGPTASTTTAPGASNKQLDYIASLLGQRDLGEEAAKALAARVAVQREINERHGDCSPPLAVAGLTKLRASNFIERLLKLPQTAPKRPAGAPRSIMSEINPRKVNADLPTPEELPAGSYAIKSRCSCPGGERPEKGVHIPACSGGQLRFYTVWRGDVATFVKLYIEHGPDSTEIKYGSHEFVAILRAIVAVGPFEAARLYGIHIGTCSNPKCGRRLTNRVSRLLGMGPICGGHSCDPSIWKSLQARARAALRDAGLDPSLDVEDTDDLARIRELAGL